MVGMGNRELLQSLLIYPLAKGPERKKTTTVTTADTAVAPAQLRLLCFSASAQLLRLRVAIFSMLRTAAKLPDPSLLFLDCCGCRIHTWR